MRINVFLWEYALRDLMKRKARSLFGIFGIAVSIFLLTTVSFITDSISYSFIDYLTVDSGGQDIVLTTQPYYGEPSNRTRFFEYAKVQQEIEANVSEIQSYIPRLKLYGRTNGSAFEPLNESYSFSFAALDIKLEEKLKFGQFQNLDNGTDLSNGIPVNSCLIEADAAETVGLKAGDTINIYLPILKARINLTVYSTFTSVLKFPIDEESQLVVDLSWWGETADKIDNANKVDTWIGKADRLIMLLKNAEEIYDIRNTAKTEQTISSIGAKILMTIGIDEWQLEYPKLENLYISNYIAMGMQVIFVMIGIISMLISGILINGILSTSVEEKIREYGINRVLGARKSYNLKLILIQATILCVSGTTLGIFGAALFVKYGVIPFAMSLIPSGYLTESIPFVAQPTSILLSYVIGIGVSLIVSISPALKVMRMKIVESINPYRHTEAVYKLEKDTGENYKLILFGSVLAANGLFIYFLLPRVFLSMDPGLIAGMLLGTLLVFLVGISLLAIGFMPAFIRILVAIFAPFNKKIINIVKITVHRYQRRNLSTIVMFVLSFSFIMFTTTIVEIQTQQVSELVRYNSGSDIQLVPTSYTIEAPTVDIQEKLMQIPGVERTSALLASPYDLTQIYAESASGDGKSFSARLGDYINFASNKIRLYGIDENYKDTVYAQNFIKFTEGNYQDAFNQVFENKGNYSEHPNIIISTALSNDLDLHLGDVARLTIQRGTEEIPVIAKIVGVASNMPGLHRFKKGAYEANYGGVIISADNYMHYFNIPGGDYAYFDRIFIKVKEGYKPEQVADQIYDICEKHGTDNIYLRVTASRIADEEQSFVIIKYLFLIILLGTVIIGLFGMISSAYSSILERTREIAVIRTLGLHPNEVNRMFSLENLILLLSSSSSGGVIGFIVASLLTENMTMFTETPRVIAVPWDIVAIIYSVSVVFLLLGLRSLLRKVKKQNLIEIYRATL